MGGFNLLKDPYPSDASEFFTEYIKPGKDSVKLQARITAELFENMEKILASGNFPYQSPSDFIRDSVWRLVSFLLPKIDPNSTPSVNQASTFSVFIDVNNSDLKSLDTLKKCFSNIEITIRNKT